MRRALTQSIRKINNSHLPAGAGGRSSWAGISACLFGCTGHIGYRITDRLGQNGIAAVLPNRGPEKAADDFKPMFDLGQYFVVENFSIKPSDVDSDLQANDNDLDYYRDLIRHTNVVINVIGARREMNRYTMGECNYDWPVRLAELCAEKNDGTKLIHLVHLNSHDAKSREESIILEQQWQAEQAMRAIYPETTIVRSSWAFGARDNYADMLTHIRWQNFKELGAWPLLYNAGLRTFHRPISSADVAEAIVRIAKHPDSPGHTFELYNENRFQLSDICELLYEAQGEEAFLFDGIKTTFDPITKERTMSPADTKSSVKQRLLKAKFGYYTARRPIPRFIDMVNRLETANTNTSYGWINEPFYNMLNQSCKIENSDNPGLSDLGIIPQNLDDAAIHIFKRFNSIDGNYSVFNRHSLKNYPLKSYPEGFETATEVIRDPRTAKYDEWDTIREKDTELFSYEFENAIRKEWSKIDNYGARNTLDMRANHYAKKTRQHADPRAPREMNPTALF